MDNNILEFDVVGRAGGGVWCVVGTREIRIGVFVLHSWS